MNPFYILNFMCLKNQPVKCMRGLFFTLSVVCIILGADIPLTMRAFGGNALVKPTEGFTIQIATFSDLEEAKKHTRIISHSISLSVYLEREGHNYIIHTSALFNQDDLKSYLNIIKEQGYPQASLSVIPCNNCHILEISPSSEIERTDQQDFLELKQKKQTGTGKVELSDVEEIILETKDVLGTETTFASMGDYHTGRAWKYYNAGNYSQAIEIFNFARLFPETELDARLGLAYCYVEQNQKEKALPLLDKLIEEQFKIRETIDILIKIGELEKAKGLCDKVLLTDSSNSDIVNLKINILIRTKKYDEASAICQRLIDQFPERGAVWLEYLKVLLWTKNWSLLSTVIQKGVDKIDRNDEARSFFVEAYLALGEEEKAINMWKEMHIESDIWSTTLLKIVDKYLSLKKLRDATNLLEKALLKKRNEIILVEKLAVIYVYLGMPEKGFEVVNQLLGMPQAALTIDITKAELLSLVRNYEASLLMLETAERDKEVGYRSEIVELECYYGLEKYEVLLEKSSIILQELTGKESIDRAKVLTLRILSQIKMGLYKEAGKDIELLSKIREEGYEPAILNVLLYASNGELEEHTRSLQVLGELLSRYSQETEIVRPQLLDYELLFDKSNVLTLRMLSAWRIADALAKHKNQDVIFQLARAEFKEGNFQRSLGLYKELLETTNDPKYKLGMVECLLGMNNKEKANKLFAEVQLTNLPEKEIPRYLQNLLKLEKDTDAFPKSLSLLPENIFGNASIEALIIIAKIQRNDCVSANNTVEKYLSDRPEDIAVFRVIMEYMGYYDKGEKGTCYEFVKYWLKNATDLYPNDTGLRYQYAKHLASHREYGLAKEQLLIIYKNDPTDVRIIRWLARICSWTNEYDESLRWYDLYLKVCPSDIVMCHEIARVNGWAKYRNNANETYERLCEKFPGNYDIFSEWQAKKNSWLGRDRTAINFYKELVARHPEDAELLFDLGQLYSRLDFSRKAEDTYGRLLTYYPENNRASFAMESETWGRKQSLELKQAYIHQEGTGDAFGNFEITRFRTDINYSPVEFSEAMDISFGLGHTIFDFMKHAGSTAEHLTMNLKKGFENGFVPFLNGEFSTYTENYHETAQFNSGLNYKILDIFDTTLWGGREDILENFNTLSNQRARYFTGGRLLWNVSERLDFSSQFKRYWYNDNNNGLEYNVSSGYKLFLYPKILRFSVEMFDFDVQSNVREYWSPADYRKYSANLSWKHYVGKDFFTGAPELYYELAFKQSIDSDSIMFTEPQLGVGWDTKRRWNVELEIKPMRSTVYDEERLFLSLGLRL